MDNSILSLYSGEPESQMNHKTKQPFCGGKLAKCTGLQSWLRWDSFLFRWEEVLFFSGAKKTSELDRNLTIDCFIRTISPRLREKTQIAFFSLLKDAYYKIRLERSYNAEVLGENWRWRWYKYNLFQNQYHLWRIGSYSINYQYFRDLYLEKYGYNFIRVVDFESLLGQEVVYRPHEGAKPEFGRITSFNSRFIFVDFQNVGRGQATFPHLLKFD